MFRRLTRFGSFVAIGVVALLVISACGGDEDEPTAAPTRPSATAGATTAPTATARPAATAPPAPTPTPRGPAGTLNIAIDTMGPEVFVGRITSGQEIALLQMIGDPLIHINNSTRALEGRLVNSWSFQKVGTDNIWTFRIMPGAIINEGQGNWTAEDVRFNFQEYLKTDSRNSITAQLRLLIDSDMKNFEVVSPSEFKTHSSRFDSSIIRAVSIGNNFVTMQPKAYSEAQGDQGYSAKPVGTGSFVFKSGQKGSRYSVEAVNNHWRKTPSVQTVNLQLAPEVATRLAMLKTGQADLANLEKRFKSELTGTLRPYPIVKQALAFVALGGQFYDAPDKNCTTCPWVGYTENAIKVRQALTIAIDRKTIIDKLLFGEATIAAAPFDWMPGNQAHVDPNWPAPEYNPTRAKQLLTEAGYPNGFNIDMNIVVTSTFPEGGDTSEAVAGYWEAIGIKVKRTPLDFTPAFREKMANRTTAGLSWILANNIKDEVLPDMRNLFSKGGAIAYLHDPKIDEFITIAAAEADEAKRAQLSRVLGQYIIDTRIGIPLFGVNGMWGASSKIRSWDNVLGYSFLNNIETITLAS